MALSKRSLLAGLSAIAATLGAVVAFDIFEDFLVEDNPLWSTVVENALPIALLAGLLYALRWLAASDCGRDYVSSVTKWSVIGTVTMLVVASWVVGLQLVQGELKPRIIVIQTTIVGTIAGLLVGYNTAEIEGAREEIRHEKNRFEALFENDPAAIADLRMHGDDPRIVDANGNFEHLFGADSEGQGLFDVVSTDDESAAAVRGHIDRGERYTTEIYLDTAEGPRDFTLELVPYEGRRDGTGRRSYAIFQDVTDFKTTQRRLERTVDQLEKSNDQLQQFAYVASHDLQEPLRMVSSYVDLLASEYEGELDDEADEYIHFAVDGAERMQAMIDDLLQYSRVRTEAEEFSETDADEVFDRTRHDLELLIDEEGATVTSDELPTVSADANQLGQLFQNLVKNAIEHGGDGTEPPRVHVSGERRDGKVVFSVSDNGPGVPEDQQERIFELFEQADRDSEGTGIGLAVCHRIVNRHGGDIWVDDDGDGATFRFTIPQDAAQQSLAPT